ncbi:hypothetical protein PVT68_13905 [Microbulbifer bruguierae]|uniref:Uncharacterized protein n=1 Tax=Microbulbifer bruguierae TaxID=3029061 RepID=A0ABY8NBP6_9GAMM|nr:hypothetical protein [Microbulbifer bruguierae]WGL15860.1 hypothetical protein PVT68_13905 [Microbulbifer bruguierae]
MNNSGVFILSAALLLLGGCGGSSGGGSSEKSAPIAAPVIEITGEANEITRDNTPKLASLVVDILQAAQDNQRIWYRGSYFDQLAAGVDKGQCEQGGRYRIEMSEDRTVLSEHYDGCRMFDDGRQQYLTASGDIRTEFSGISSSGDFSVRTIYRDYLISVGQGEQERLDALMEYRGNSIDGSEKRAEVRMDLHARSSVEGEMKAKNIHFFVAPGVDFMNYMDGVQDLSGTIEYVGIGTTNLEFDTAAAKILFRGDGESRGEMRVYQQAVYIGFDAAGDGAADYGLSVPLDRMEDIPFQVTAPSTPYIRTETAWDLKGKTFFAGEPSTFSILQNFMDAGGHLLEYSVDVVSVVQKDYPSDPLYGEPEPVPFHYTVEQPAAGLVTIETDTEFTKDLAVFELEISAVNTIGSESERPLSIEVYVYLDTDKDGTSDYNDDDDDNDGVQDYYDALPKDATESEDADGDGIGDNADLDDDNDGTEDIADFYPNDNLCFAESDGDGTRCWFHQLGYLGDWEAVLGRDGVVYYHNPDELELKRWDSVSGHFLPSIFREPATIGSTSDHARMYHARPQHALYFLYDDRVISRVSLGDTEPQETFFARAPDETVVDYLYNMDFAPLHTVLLGQNGLGRLHHSYDLQGGLVDARGEELEHYDDSYYRWADSSAFCVNGFRLDKVTGEFEELGEGSQFEDPCGTNWMNTGRQPTVSPDGTLAILSGGRIINASQEELVHVNLPGGVVEWGNAGIYLLNSNKEVIYRYSADGEELESIQLYPNKYPTRVLSNDERLIWFDGSAPNIIVFPAE